MKNGERQFPESHLITYTNATGADIASGALVPFGGRFGVANTDIESGKSGTLHTQGQFSFTKGTGYALSAGQRVTWDGAKVVGWTPASTTPCMGVMAEAAGTNATAASVLLGDVPPRVFAKAHAVTGDEDSANAATIDTGFGADPSVVNVQIKNGSNVHRSPQGAVTFGTDANLGKVTVNDSGLAAGEVIHLIAYE